ncbi:MAG: disulfide bond formation protein B [Erythrobacter sp.]|uniref:disulfide bond formation protein B n=1 Tax=Erythrobacter sp. TaxID=1042 RepID=UPI0025DCAE5C|nr:disulfide bond formation protein B [Erythrobacter sp.]MCM0000485.1 disulfide bond formation protein B [Erythrobacter sp.]
MDNLAKARALAVLVPAALLGGAYVSQYGFGLYPCEMCWWQRYPHFVAVALGLAGFVVKPAARPLVILAGLAIIVSGAIGLFHAGVEYGWWEGITDCTARAPKGSAFDFGGQVVPCDVPQWTLWGLSLAGFNFLISGLGGAAVVALAAYRR